MSEPVAQAVQRITGALGVAVGAAGVFLPETLGEAYGMEDTSPENRYTTRLWGSATIFLSVTAATARPGAERRRVMSVLTMVNAVDLLAAVLADGIEPRSKALAAATSAAFGAATLYVDLEG